MLEEVSRLQVQYCGLQEQLSKLEVAIRQIRVTQTSSDVIQSCPLSSR